MATVNSLVCWGGRTGKTVTLTIASPCVVTSTNHGLRDGTGLVLAAEGGFLRRLLPPFRFGLGGPIGSGRQWMPWIHRQDQVALIDFLLHDAGASGPYNACAPEPVRNRVFSQALGRVLRRPAFMPLPAVLLRLGLGELAELLLGGQRALPRRLLEAGFRFRFNALDAALDDLLQRAPQ